MLNRRLDLWLPTYVLSAPMRAYRRLVRRRRLTHIILLVCDHFEPRFWIKREQQAAERLQSWRTGYAQFQKRCLEKFGTKPIHTWFYPPHHGPEHLQGLADMVFEGLGEVELHYHHAGDTAETLARDLKVAIAQYNRWGHLLESGDEPRPSFGFVHGDWALGNSCGGKFCGVNDELTVLERLGCWGDFTMPSGDASQTRKINSIYYAEGDSRSPKSHNWGEDSHVGMHDPHGMFLMQGPLGINWRASRFPRIENASLTSANWGRPDRIRKWLDCQIHVKGRPDWLFVKLHTHGAWELDFDALFGEKAFEMHRVLNEQYNDGVRFRLHYATARQAYNIAKAAEHGKQGSPADWLDYMIKPQPHSFYTLDAPHDLVHCTKSRLKIDNIEFGKIVALRVRVGLIKEVTGSVSAIDIDDMRGTIVLETAETRAELTLNVDAGFHLNSIEGGIIVPMQTKSGYVVIGIARGSKCLIRYRAGAKQDVAAN